MDLWAPERWREQKWPVLWFTLGGTRLGRHIYTPWPAHRQSTGFEETCIHRPKVLCNTHWQEQTNTLDLHTDVHKCGIPGVHMHIKQAWSWSLQFFYRHIQYTKVLLPWRVLLKPWKWTGHTWVHSESWFLSCYCWRELRLHLQKPFNLI